MIRVRRRKFGGMMAMKRLVRKLRKSGENNHDDDKFSLPTLDDSRPMDINEQEELVRSFERAHAQQTLLWKSIFATILLSFTAFLIYSIYQQTLSPWELRYHAYFMEDLESWMLICADWLAVMTCSISVTGLLHNSKHRRQLLLSSCCLGILLAIFWFYYMLRLPRFRWDVIWLPLAPLCGAGLCLYVDHLFNESSEEIRKLRGYMYSFKRN